MLFVPSSDPYYHLGGVVAHNQSGFRLATKYRTEETVIKLDKDKTRRIQVGQQTATGSRMERWDLGLTLI